MNRIVVPFLIAAALAAFPAAAAAPHDPHHGHESPALSLDAGRKWATDEPLRREMTGLREALAYAHKRQLPAAEYRALGDVVEYRVGRIVEECKLPPAADANLHVVVAELVGAADELRASNGMHLHQAVRRATVALNEYGKHFDHPGWKPLP